MTVLVSAEAIRTLIERAYIARLARFPMDQPLGWRLLYSPQSVLDGARVAFLGFNPGGSSVDPAHGVFSCERGSAYRKEIEAWGPNSGLQDQVMALFHRLSARPEEVLAGNLVPFRSRDEASLRDPDGAVAFGEHLWRRILAGAQPGIVISMGATANRAVSRILNVEGAQKYPVGWGSYTASRGRYANGVWIRLPHLSRFAIFNRPQSRAELNLLFDGL